MKNEEKQCSHMPKKKEEESQRPEIRKARNDIEKRIETLRSG